MNSAAPPHYARLAIPKKGRLHEKVMDLLSGAGLQFHRQARLDVAVCTNLALTLVFLPAADIATFCSEGNVDLGITGVDVVQETQSNVTILQELGFGKCKLCLQAPVPLPELNELAGKRIVTSFPHLARKYFDQLDQQYGTTTQIRFVSGSVEAACGLGLADAVVDLVETGTTMRVCTMKEKELLCIYIYIYTHTNLTLGCRFGYCG